MEGCQWYVRRRKEGGREGSRSRWLEKGEVGGWKDVSGRKEKEQRG